MKTQISLGVKLLAGFSTMLALTLILGYTSMRSLSGMMDSYDSMADKTARKIVLADQINTAESDMLALQRGMMLNALVKDTTKLESSRQAFNAKADAVQKAIAELTPLLLDAQAKDAMAHTQSEVAQWRSVFAELAQLCAAGKPDEAFKLGAEKTVPLYDAAAKEADLVTQIQMERLNGDRKTAADDYSLSRWIALLMIGLSVAGASVILWVVRQANGTLRRMALELSQGAEQVAGAAAQVASASQSLAQGASEQAASLEETSASSEEMSSMTQRNAENAKSAAGLMMEAAQIVEHANGTLEHMVKSMNEIKTSSDKIAKIIKVIDEIAFQTNILALNAAVEAARAGEAGMGFAVVADEVRNLAQRSAQAAKDTASLIEESIAKSGEGRKRLDDVVSSISAITDSAHKVKELVDEVNLGSQEQARGIEQVSKAVTQMQQVTQKTAANAEESAAASEELSAQAGTTRSVVERLQALVGASEVFGDAATHTGRGRIASLRPRSSRDLKAFASAVEAGGKPGAGGPAQTGSWEKSGEPVQAGRTDFPLEDGFKGF